MPELSTKTGWRSRLHRFFHSDVVATLAGRPQPVKAQPSPPEPLRTNPLEALERHAATGTDRPRRKLTRGAKFIAFYVLLVSYGAFNRGLDFDSVHSVRRTLIVLTGMAGSILLFKRNRLAKPVFLAWAFLIALGITPFASGPNSDPLVFRVLATALSTGMLVLIYREVEHNVLEDWEREEHDLDDD